MHVYDPSGRELLESLVIRDILACLYDRDKWNDLYIQSSTKIYETG